MPRRNRPTKRIPPADPIFHEVSVAKFINQLMRRGKKSIAERIFYQALERIGKKLKDKTPIEVFQEALKKATPLVEVKARRVGGSTYQVPVEVRPDRGWALASRWVIRFAQQRSGKSMEENLAAEIMDIYNNLGPTLKKKDETHKMAEANKAFAHYRY